jgi:hypothetical protein
MSVRSTKYKHKFIVNRYIQKEYTHIFLTIKILDVQIRKDSWGEFEIIFYIKSNIIFSYRRFHFRFIEELKLYYNITNVKVIYMGLFEPANLYFNLSIYD